MNLVYFTAAYPFGLGEVWKTNELNEMRFCFDSLTVIPYSYDGNPEHPKQLPDNVTLRGPLFELNGVMSTKWDFFRIIKHPKRQLFIKEFFEKRVYTSKIKFQSWLTVTMNSIRLLRHPIIRDIISKGNKNTSLIFFWGKGSSDFLPFVDTGKFGKVLVRMHRYDLFEDINNGYIPYRDKLHENISMAGPSSTAGLNHLLERYPPLKTKIQLFRLGTLISGKRVEGSTDKVLRIVSCSYLSPVKRVELMIAALKYVKFPVIWKHVGDGMLRSELEEKITAAGLQGKFIIEGMIETGKLPDYYLANTFDLFVNVSSSEGIPMSIMEVLSLGIPVMATAVGGNAEIVNDQVGKLLPANPTPKDIAQALQEFYHLPYSQRLIIRDNAFASCKENWEVGKLTRQVIDYLKS